MDLLGSEYTEADEKAVGNDADSHSQLDTGRNKLESPLVRFTLEHPFSSTCSLRNFGMGR